MTDARVARAALKVLSKPDPQARVARVAVKVLVRRNAAPTGPTVYWWDGSALALIDTDASGYWDGSAIQPIDWDSSGWWDGSAIQPIA